MGNRTNRVLSANNKGSGANSPFISFSLCSVGPGGTSAVKILSFPMKETSGIESEDSERRTADKMEAIGDGEVITKEADACRFKCDRPSISNFKRPELLLMGIMNYRSQVGNQKNFSVARLAG
jgi:hypothetical protein